MVTLSVRGKVLHTSAGVATGESDVFRFAPVPAGTFTMRVYDGLSASEPVECTVIVDQAVEVAVRFPPLSGFTLELQDAAGNRLYDADAVGLERIDGPTEGFPRQREILDPGITRSPERGEGSGCPPGFVFVGVAGRYGIAVTKPGYEPTLVDFYIEVGKITPVVCVMEPEQR